jgi:hypothetical protein
VVIICGALFALTPRCEQYGSPYICSLILCNFVNPLLWNSVQWLRYDLLWRHNHCVMFGCGKFFSLLRLEHSLEFCESAGSWSSHNGCMKSSIFWDITPYKSTESQPTLRRSMSPPSSGSKNKQFYLLNAGCLAYSSTLNRHVPPKCLLTFNGLQGVIARMIHFFGFGVLRLLRIAVIWKRRPPPYQKGLYQERCSFLSHMNVL